MKITKNEVQDCPCKFGKLSASLEKDQMIMGITIPRDSFDGACDPANGASIAEHMFRATKADVVLRCDPNSKWDAEGQQRFDPTADDFLEVGARVEIPGVKLTANAYSFSVATEWNEDELGLLGAMANRRGTISIKRKGVLERRPVGRPKKEEEEE